MTAPDEGYQHIEHGASIAAKRAMLLNGGVALWDVIESCDIKGSSDASIRNVVPAHIERITGAAPIEQVICNGGTAGRLYKRYLQERTGLPAIVLPSTSPANAAWRLERLVERWSEAVDWQAFSPRSLSVEKILKAVSWDSASIGSKMQLFMILVGK